MPKIELTPATRQALRARAHALNPVVTIAGNGLASSVLAELERSLQAHELIKVRTQGIEREEREALLADICDQLGAAPVQRIGNILVIWRPRREEKAPEKKAPTPPNPATAKSAAAFAAAARRAVLAKASAEQKRAEGKRPWRNPPQGQTPRTRTTPRGGR
ncbi:MAG: YhbY family RNA-binding protein [Azoarcus sp.]|jgi:putative YhbY family RNA-binding protein|nr:YhbY family RNA-binding protein [Azoarcus sp.]